MALLRTDPFREVDRLFQQVWGPSIGRSTMSMPIDAYRKGDQFLVRVDLPGVRSEAIELTVEDNVLTVKAERPVPEFSGEVDTLVAERVYGSLSRQLFLGHNLDTSKIEARYEDGVLNIAIPVAEHARPRRISVGTDGESVRLTAETGERH